jgi:chromosome segregation protein
MLDTEARTIAKMLAAGGTQAQTPVSEMISADDGLETALGAVLGDDLDSALEDAAPSYWSMPGDASDDPALPAGTRPLSDFVRAPNELQRGLRQIGLVEENAGDHLRLELKPGQRLVTREGMVWRWDGHTAKAGAPSAAALRLQQKNRLAALEAEKEEADIQVEDCETRHGEAVDAVRRDEARLQSNRDMERLLARKLAEAREALLQAERASGELLRQKDAADSQIAGYAAQLEEMAIAEEDARIALADAPDLSLLDNTLREQGLLVAQRRAGLAEARANHDSEARENDARRRRITAIAAERQVWKDREHSAGRQIETLASREEEARIELKTCWQPRRNSRTNAAACSTRSARPRQHARMLQTGWPLRRTLSARPIRAAAQALTGLAEAREKRGRSEERLLSAREWRVAAEVRIRETLSCEPHEVMRLTGLRPDEALPETRVTEIELERLKMERERLGAVNLRAEEEQMELTENSTRW